MNLSGIFGGNIFNDDSKVKNVAKTNTTSQEASGQTNSFKDGEVVKAQVLSAKDSQIQLSINGETINGKMDTGISLEKGQNLTVSVKIGNDGQVIFTPLYENTAKSQNVLQAIQMANLPLSETTVKMVEGMMSEGLPIHKEALNSMYQSLEIVGEENLQKAIGLEKMGISITPENCVQYGNYEDFKHAVSASVGELINDITNSLGELSQHGQIVDVLSFVKDVFMINNEQNTEVFQNDKILSTLEPEEKHELIDDTTKSIELQNQQDEKTLQMAQLKSDLVNLEAFGSKNQVDFLFGTNLEENERKELGQELMKTLGMEPSTNNSDNVQFSPENLQKLAKQLLNNLPEQISKLQNLDNPENKTKDYVNLNRVLTSKLFGKALQGLLEDRLFTTPEKLASEGSVKELYQKLYQTTERLSRLLPDMPQNTNSALEQHVTNLRQNLDFMNQINQLQTYVQIPVKLSGQNGNGDLYVYTNKKNLLNKDGAVTALLHLDMDSLGPTDVFLSLQQERLRTKFYLAEESSIELIEQNLPLLNERLAKKGFIVTGEVLKREDMKQEGLEENFMNVLLKKTKSATIGGVQGFDVMA